jgi:predicted sulfurtransferase
MRRNVGRLDPRDGVSIDLEVESSVPPARCDRCNNPVCDLLRITLAAPRCELAQAHFCPTCLRQLANEVDAR